MRVFLKAAGLDHACRDLEPRRRQAQALLPPLRIPIRTQLERSRRGFTPREQAAIARELAAGRVLDVPRGFRGLAGGLSLRDLLPPIAIPKRTGLERSTGKAFTPAEAEAIARELQAGRGRSLGA